MIRSNTFHGGGWLWRLRCWAIRRLAGRDMVIINARVEGRVMAANDLAYCLVVGVTTSPPGAPRAPYTDDNLQVLPFGHDWDGIHAAELRAAGRKS
jgi:hypothetical protein